MKLIPWDAWTRMRNHAAVLDNEFDDLRENLQDIAEYILPRDYKPIAAGSGFASSGGASENRRGLIATRSRGGLRGGRRSNIGAGRKRMEKILNSTGTQAATSFGAAAKDSVISPARRWLTFVPGFHPKPDGKDPEVGSEERDWMEDTANRMLRVFFGSNLGVAGQQMFLDLGAFGNDCHVLYEDDEDVIRFFHSPVGEFRWSMGSDRQIDGMTRVISMTVDQVVQEFGIENVSEQTRREWLKGGAERDYEVIVSHKIERNRPDIDQEMLFGDRGEEYAYREFYWENMSGQSADRHRYPQTQRRYRNGRSMAQLLDITGYQENPIIASRFRVPGDDTYGVGPGHDVLPDVKQLQRMEQMKGQIVAIAADPPMQAPASLQQTIRGVRNPWLPGTTLFTLEPNARIGPVRTTDFPFDALSREIARLEARINNGFFLDLFKGIMMLDTVRSATEIQERVEEKMTLLGGMLERMQRETLNNIVSRTFGIMRRRDMIADPPGRLAEVGFRPKYHSILSAAQLASDVGSVERFFRTTKEFAQVAPESLYVIRYPAMLRGYGDRLSIPSEWFRSEEEVEEIEAAQQARAQSDQALVDAQTGENLARALGNLGGEAP